MKILKLELEAVGPFTNRTFDLSQGSEGLQVLFGPNGAGRSSARKAWEHFLFGFPKQCKAVAFEHDYTELRIGAQLQTASGQVLHLYRRKGNKSTLLDAEGNAVDESILEPFLGGLGREAFNRTHALVKGSLEEGARALLDGGGEVGESILTASAGVPVVRDLERQLSEALETLFKPRAKKNLPPVNQALAQLSQGEAAVGEASLSPEDWEEADQEQRGGQAAQARLDAMLREVRTEQTSVTRLERVLPRIAQRGLIHQRLGEPEAEGAVPELRDGFVEERVELLGRLTTTTSERQRLGARVEQVEQQADAIVLPESLLAQGSEIRRLHSDLGARRANATTRVELQADLERLTRELAELEANVGPERDPLRAEQRARIEELAAERGELEARITTTQRSVDRRARKLEQLQEELAALPPAQDQGSLRQAVSRSQAAGDLEERLQDLAGEAKSTSRTIARLTSRLQFATGFEPGATSAPDENDVEEWGQASSQLDRRETKLTANLERLQAELLDTNARLDALERVASVPGEEDLVQGRERRDLGWSLVRTRYVDGKKADLKRETAFAGERALVDAYEDSIAGADDVADRMRREAKQVAARAELEVKRLTLAPQTEAAEQALGALASDREHVQECWAELWAPVAATPASAKQARTWIQNLEKLHEATAELAQHEASRSKLTERVEALIDGLTEALEILGVDDQPVDDSLAALLSLAQVHLETHQEAARQRGRLEQRVRDAERSVVDERAELRVAETAHATWSAAWGPACKPLGLTTTATAGEARGVLALLADVADRRGAVARRQAELIAVDAAITAFDQATSDLVAEIDPSLSPLTAARRVEELVRLLDAALLEQQSRATLVTSLEHLREELAQVAARATQAQQALLALCAEAGASTADELPSLEQRAREATGLRERLTELELDLVADAGGASLEELLALSEEVDPNELPARAQELSAQEEALDGERTAALQGLGAVRERLAGWKGTTHDAAEQAELAEATRAELAVHVANYRQACLERLLLSRLLEAYRSRSQGPLIQRASEIFSRITLGEYTGLATDYDERDRAVLVGVTPTNRRKKVNALSSGAREQLYLALRLACVERHADRSPDPLPLLVDDAVLESDEDRMSAILAVLAELSERLQVILFTRQRRHAELAEGLGLPEQVFVHAMPTSLQQAAAPIQASAEDGQQVAS